MNATNEIITQPVLPRVMRITAVVILTLTVLIGSAAAQSFERDKPTKLTINEVKGVWSGNDENIEHYYSFVAGPGEIKILLDYAKDSGDFCFLNAQLSDTDGRILTNLEINGSNSFGGMTSKNSERTVARFQLKRRQTIIIKVWVYWSGGFRASGHYKIQLEGAVSLDQVENINQAESKDSRLDCLPKSGIMRLIMSDGTTQEINLSRVKEASIKP